VELGAVVVLHCGLCIIGGLLCGIIIVVSLSCHHCAAGQCNCIIKLWLLASKSSKSMLGGVNLHGEVDVGSVLGEVVFGLIVLGHSWWGMVQSL